MDKHTNSQTVGLVSLLTLITVLVGYYSLRPGRQQLPPLSLKQSPKTAGKTAAAAAPDDADSRVTTTPPRTAQELVVHVAGAVNRPDVYRLTAGSRVNDAIRAAGGPTQAADTNALNLAAPVQDGSRIYVPRQGEQPQESPQRETSQRVGVSNPGDAAQPPQTSSPNDTAAPAADNGSARTSAKLSAGQGTVNINSAGLEDLQRLPGIGPAIAQRIIDYRQANRGFKSVEEIREVSGIGEKKYEKLAGLISVN